MRKTLKSILFFLICGFTLPGCMCDDPAPVSQLARSNTAKKKKKGSSSSSDSNFASNIYSSGGGGGGGGAITMKSVVGDGRGRPLVLTDEFIGSFYIRLDRNPRCVEVNTTGMNYLRRKAGSLVCSDNSHGFVCSKSGNPPVFQFFESGDGCRDFKSRYQRH